MCWRRATAQVKLTKLLSELPDGSRESSLIVECKARDLLDAIDADLDLKTTLRDPATALEHALLYMHDNRVLELDKGRSVGGDDFASLRRHRLQSDNFVSRSLETRVVAGF